MVSPLLRNSRIIYKVWVNLMAGAETALIRNVFPFQSMYPVL